MESFWGSDVWGSINLIGILLLSLLIANALKRSIRVLKASLIPTSVLAGILLLITAQNWISVLQTQLLPHYLPPQEQIPICC